MSDQSNDIPEGFKITELGLLPQEWELVKLGEIALARGGIGFSPEYQGQLSGKYPFYKVSDMNLSGNERFMRKANNYVDENIVSLLKAKPFPPDSVIFPKVGAAIHTNKKRLLTSDALVDNNVMGVTISDRNRCIPEYLLCWFESVDIGEFSNPGPLPSINAHSVKDRMLPLPPLPEQYTIAWVLSTIQKAIDAQDKIIAAARELKKALMRHLFTYGPVPVAEAEQVPLKETEIGLVPEHWEVVRLGEVTDKPEYGYTATASSEITGPKFLRITDIQNSMVYWSSVPYCQCPSIEMDRYKLHSGDILFARIGATTGKTYLVEDCPPAVFASYLIRVRCNSSLLPAYLSQFTTTQDYWNQINALKSDRLKHGINTPNLKSLLIPFPSLPEQQEIARMLSGVDNKIEAEENHKSALQAVFKAMLHQLMTGKVRVKDLEATAA